MLKKTISPKENLNPARKTSAKSFKFIQFIFNGLLCTLLSILIFMKGPAEAKGSDGTKENFSDISSLAQTNMGPFDIKFNVSLLTGELQLDIFHDSHPLISYGSRVNSMNLIDGVLIFSWKTQKRIPKNCRLVTDREVLKEIHCGYNHLRFFYDENFNLVTIKQNQKNIFAATYYGDLDALRTAQPFLDKDRCQFSFKYSRLSRTVQSTELQKTCLAQKTKHNTLNKETSIAFFEIDP